MSEGSARDEKYNGVIDRARLMEVVLTSSEFSVSHNFADEKEASDKFIDEDVMDLHYDPAEEMVFGYVQCRVWMNRASDNAPETKPSLEEAIDKSVFSVQATYFVAVNVEGTHDEGDVKAFFERTGPFVAWPYFRAHVAQLAAAANYEIPILPIKRVLVPFTVGGGYRKLRAGEDASDA